MSRSGIFAWCRSIGLFATGLAGYSGPLVAAVQVDTASYRALEWRAIGPFRGGRSVAVAGVPDQRLTYYFGGTGGGVWKTDDAGGTWRNVSDGFFQTGSVGAIAVAPSDANVVYVGMGEHAVRGVTTSHGDGVYRSTDAGKTWTRVGLERTRAIARIRVHPGDPNLVYAAAQGAPYGPTKERGVYRSRDGGATWELVLHVNETTGASELAMDAENPRILYAGFWDHERKPWTVRSGGPGSGIYKSSDGGDTWQKLGEGLPKLMGKTAVDVSAANPERVWALIEAEDGGLFRSDDAGKTWRRVNGERVLVARAWYYIEVYADPLDEETVYVMNAPFLKSIDGGRSFATVRVPHGDNHDLWINPHDSRVMINANDGGANISFNGGATWSTQENQPTAQFYRVNTDNQFHYHVYGGQQDNTTVAIASSTDDNGIDWKDWYPVSGCESAHVAFDPDDPVLVYAGCYQGQISEYDHRTKQVRDIMAYPVLGLAMEPAEMRYRFNWNAPIVVSRHDPRVVYHAGNVLLKTENRGLSWMEVSADLTRNDKAKQGPGGHPITNEGAGGEVYNTIMYVAESPLERGTLWVGTDDGLVHVTRDAGASWRNVTPEDIGEAQINAIETSPHDPATAYIAVTRYKSNDFTPHVLRTTDYGESWKRVVRGIAPEAWVRVVREDPVRRGLLYAGTETGAYVSFDGGERWQSLQLNLPVVPITDLAVHGSDLVAATQGRSFWILDDLSPLRQLDERSNARIRLYRPRPAYRAGGPSAEGDRLGKNPPQGAVLYYHLSQALDSSTAVTLEVVDGAGRVVQRASSAQPDTAAAPSPDAPARTTRLTTTAGLNRFVWDLRHERERGVPGVFVYGNLQGRVVVPGSYRVRLIVGADTVSENLEVRPDPRLELAATDFEAQEALLASAREMLNEVYGAVRQIRGVKEQLAVIVKHLEGQAHADTVRRTARALSDSLTTLEEQLIQPKQKTFQDVINFPNRLNAQLVALEGALGGSEPPVTEGQRRRRDDLAAEWARHRATLDRLLGERLGAFNALCRELEVPAVVAGKEYGAARR